MSDTHTQAYTNQDSMMRLDAYNQSSELQTFLSTIINEYTKISKRRLKLLLFLGEMTYAEKHNGETMGTIQYQISTGIWSQESEHILTNVLPELYNVTVETTPTAPYQNPITHLRTPPNTTLQLSANTASCELGEIVATATKHKSHPDLRFWFDNTRLARMHSENEVLPKSVINQYVTLVTQNKVVPVWSQLI
jgi:hypothetical protein